ncbi:MAG: hypothetical protein GEU81_00745 [Nitriliruptorales bacterium]|nr:hypothetical protein [Nitriliruptorales bacterium]
MAKLTKLGGGCQDGRTCPAVFVVDDGDAYIVQGWELTDPEILAELQLPAGESAVKIPASLVEVMRSAGRG